MKKYAIGIDRGGASVKYALIDNEGVFHFQGKLPSKADVSAEAVIGQLVTACKEAMASALQLGVAVEGIGIGTPGIVDETNRIVLGGAENIKGWENLNLADRIEAETGLPVQMGNDANLMGLGETMYGAGQGAQNVVFLTVGTGIGGAVVRDGEVVMGSHGFAGEIGHLSVAMDGPLCSCGRHGCLEAFAGRRALVEAAGIAEDGDATSSEAIDMFLQRWRAGDSDVAKVVDQAADALVSAIASAVNLVDVDTVLLGGLWTHFGDELATVLEGRLRSEILGYPNVKIRVFVPPVALHPSLYGAAEMGLRRFIENPLGYMGEK